MTLPEKEKKGLRDVSELSRFDADPEGSKKAARSVAFWLAIATMLFAAGFVIFNQLAVAGESPETWAGFMSAVASGGVIAVTLVIYYMIAFWMPKFLKYPYVLVGVLSAGWFVRGFFEEAAVLSATHSGYWAGVWTGFVGISVLVGLFIMFRFKPK